MKKTLILLLSLFIFSSITFAYNKYPGKGITVKPARATWNTGFFQEAIVSKGLEELGYKVKKPVELQNPIFYQSLKLGDLDYWTNGWMPMHNAQFPKGFHEKAGTHGYVMKAGGLQGYLVSKKHAEQYNIKSLDDFRRPEVKKAFDKNGDGKADLISCPPGWGCEKVTAHHMKVYNLKKDINLIKASYSASIAQGLTEFKAGQPVFFYTWAPNWTIFKLKPGKDVVWINVPEINPTDAQKSAVERMTVKDVEGAVSNPVKLGFVVSDIQIVANKKFTEANPAAKKFFEVFSLPLADVNEQSTQMQDGQSSQKHIERHADEWIVANKGKWNKWIEAARNAAK